MYKKLLITMVMLTGFIANADMPEQEPSKIQVVGRQDVENKVASPSSVGGRAAGYNIVFPVGNRDETGTKKFQVPGATENFRLLDILTNEDRLQSYLLQFKFYEEHQNLIKKLISKVAHDMYLKDIKGEGINLISLVNKNPQDVAIEFYKEVVGSQKPSKETSLIAYGMYEVGPSWYGWTTYYKDENDKIIGTEINTTRRALVLGGGAALGATVLGFAGKKYYDTKKTKNYLLGEQQREYRLADEQERAIQAAQDAYEREQTRERLGGYKAGLEKEKERVREVTALQPGTYQYNKEQQRIKSEAAMNRQKAAKALAQKTEREWGQSYVDYLREAEQQPQQEVAPVARDVPDYYSYRQGLGRSLRRGVGSFGESLGRGEERKRDYSERLGRGLRSGVSRVGSDVRRSMRDETERRTMGDYSDWE